MSDVPPYIAEAMKEAAALGNWTIVRAMERAEALRQERVAASIERRRVQNRLAQRRHNEKIREQREEQKRRRVDREFDQNVTDGEVGDSTDQSSWSESKSLVSVSGKKKEHIQHVAGYRHNN